mmetsp:Transcript_11235/g.16766  ORF Transcript_11235/g.16766 Transcript_11235/m.16766 type:complete len:235 (-) Transcript_11235:509-1213(-)
MSSDYEDSFEDEEEEGEEDNDESKDIDMVNKDGNLIKSDTAPDGIPTFSWPMYIPHTVYRASYRSTHSDVMCSTITSQRKDWAKEVKKKAQHSGVLCRLPYEEQSRTPTNSIASINSSAKGSNNDPTTTRLEQKQSEVARQRLSKELHAEHRVFMERLRREREERTKLEADASVTIQRFVRGLAVRDRLNPKKYAAMRTPFVYSDDEIRRLINEASEKSGLPPILDETFDFSTI